jgi:hypothetical protein
MVDITVSTFITWIEAIGDAGEVHFEDAGHAAPETGWLQSGQPYDVIVDVAEAVGHLVGDGAELAAGEPVR